MVDLAMPNMHGDELVAGARKLIPEVPTLFVTGYAEPGRVRQRPEGDILKKPFRRAQLAEKLRWVLPSRRRGVAAIPPHLNSNHRITH
jgi:CheY-like chemotaxis protein